ncbi:MAG: hypothetical protein HYV34_00520 [Candidatus Kerfeldbacteria bacterium]|nr:hypothetical protein [Candidatus Kerfeldbacteria bacterium]
MEKKGALTDGEKEIGRMIHDARTKQGFSQLYVSRQARKRGWFLSQCLISSIENGSRRLSNLNALMLMAILGCRELALSTINPHFSETLAYGPDRQDPALRAFLQEFVGRLPEKDEGFFDPSPRAWFKGVCAAAIDRLLKEQPDLFQRDDWRRRPRGPVWPPDRST